MNMDMIGFREDPPVPAAGSNFIYTVPAGRRGILYGIDVKIVTDATAIPRLLHLELGYLYFLPLNALNTFPGQFQNETVNYICNCIGPEAITARQVRMPKHPLEIPAGESIQTVLFYKQAGDQISVKWRYKEVAA